jgi:hypothetical protein
MFGKLFPTRQLPAHSGSSVRRNLTNIPRAYVPSQSYLDLTRSSLGEERSRWRGSGIETRRVVDAPAIGRGIDVPHCALRHSALPNHVGVRYERVVPAVWRIVVDKNVHPAVNSDLERRREVNRAPKTGSAFAPDEHPFARFHYDKSRSVGRADRQFGATPVRRAARSNPTAFHLAVRP